MDDSSQKRDQGMALLMALLFISVALVALGALGSRLMNQRLAVNQYQTYQETFQALESATAMSKVELESGEDGAVGMEAWTPTYSGDNLPILPDFDESGMNWATLPEMPDVQMGAYAVNWFTDGRDSNGDGTVDNNAERFMYTIYAQAEENGLVRRSEVIYKGGDVNVWRNAIFAGSGQAGGLINGNVSIHGSVHLLGNDLPEGQTAIAAIDLSGTSLIHNNYGGMPAGLADRIPALETTPFQGETIESLNANLRVKNGLVGMSGNSEVGEPNVVGNAIKETMDGTFVTDGWTGNSVIDDGDRGDPTAVFSDNGWDEEYDLGDKVPFPLLTDDWRDPDTGARTVNAATGTWYTHEEYFNEVLLADAAIPTDGTYNGSITLDAKGTAFYWNASTNQQLTGAAAVAAVPGVNDDYIQFDPDTNVLKMNGQIRINGNLSFVGQGADKTVNYTGRAAFLVYGDIEVDTN
ncbi:MAG: hypothetical protein HYV26_19285, partial [Candidatus Hydrogenedentes bacterium]|nr:hypothetical protein [Candidatus Hydrogenedentota bacterium]